MSSEIPGNEGGGVELKSHTHMAVTEVPGTRESPHLREMSSEIPGNEGGGVELKSHTHMAATEVPGTRESPHLRFQIEDVREDPQSPSPHTRSSGTQLGSSSTSHPHTSTITSLGYDTSEAVPMTMYYRDNEEEGGGGGGKARPTLDYLRERSRGGSMAGHSEGGGERQGIEEIDSGETTSQSPAKKKRWWQSSGEKKPQKFGWITGVLIRCLLNIWGVMLFIRLSWVVGQAGIGLAVVIILLSSVVTVITTLSMSAICTNGEVKGGGAYYLISRSLGPEFGGAIGIIFSLANAVAVALYIVGFAETVSDLIQVNDAVFTGTPEHDIRIIGFAVVVLLLTIALIGLDWEAKIQIVLLVILLLAIGDFIIGTFIPVEAKRSMTAIGLGNVDLQGYTSYSGKTFVANFLPNFRRFDGTSQTFFTVFAVFFPAATGILAGANISGDLKDPQKAIPKGTFLAIGITTVVYVLMAIMVGMVMTRDAPGPDLLSGLTSSQYNNSCTNNSILAINIFSEGSNDSCSTETPYDFVREFPDCACVFADNCTSFPPFCGDDGTGVLPTADCVYGDRPVNPEVLKEVCSRRFLDLFNGSQQCGSGLHNNFQVMALVSVWSPIVTAGIFAATLSSALTSLVSAPKVFQRVCQDNVFPYIIFFAKGGGRTGTEPIRAYILTFVIAVACIAIAKLNQIAEIISTFFLMAYALINFACFAASVAKSPGWRPAFKYYNQWVALVGALMCVAIMFVIRWYFALITIVVVGALYMVVQTLKPDINWGSSTQAFLYSYSMRNLLKLEKLEDHVKNFRPQFLVLTGPPSSRPDMVHFFNQISREVGVMVCGHVLLGNYTENRKMLLHVNERQRKWLRKEKVKAFCNVVSANNMQEGVRSLLQLTGLGKLRPNTLVIGFKRHWERCPQQDVEDYVSLLHDAFDLNFGVVIFRLRAGFDATEEKEDHGENPEVTVGGHAPVKAELSSGRHSDSPPTDTWKRSSITPLLEPTEKPAQGSEFTEIPLVTLTGSPSVLRTQRSYQLIEEEEEEEEEASLNIALSDGYRLDFEDEEERRGSLAPSLPKEGPELVTMPSRFEKVQQRGTIDVWWIYDDGGLAILLPYLLSRNSIWKNCKLRIFTGASSRGIDKAKLRMTSLLQKFRISFSEVIEVSGINDKPSSESIEKYRDLPGGTAADDDKELDKLTNRHIRLGELLREHSSNASVIVMTISVPQRGVPSQHYMSWLETMSHSLPPILLMRGNQSSVLTFYS